AVDRAAPIGAQRAVHRLDTSVEQQLLNAYVIIKVFHVTQPKRRRGDVEFSIGPQWLESGLRTTAPATAAARDVSVMYSPELISTPGGACSRTRRVPARSL
nr:hypothetical protein [Candidatus Eremiobacteraeota bacterium]